MRIDDWTIPTYSLAVCLVLALLLGGQSSAAHAAALAPFAVLVAALAGAGRRPGRVLALLGLIALALIVAAFATSTADWYADCGLVLGVFLFIAALLRSGAAALMRRHKTLAIVLGSMVGLVMVWSGHRPGRQSARRLAPGSRMRRHLLGSCPRSVLCRPVPRRDDPADLDPRGPVPQPDDRPGRIRPGRRPQHVLLPRAADSDRCLRGGHSDLVPRPVHPHPSLDNHPASHGRASAAIIPEPPVGLPQQHQMPLL